MNAVEVLRGALDDLERERRPWFGEKGCKEQYEALARIERLVEADKEFDAARSAIIYAGLNLDEEMYRVGSRLQMASMVRSLDLAAVLGEEGVMDAELTGTVAEISDNELVRRAVHSAIHCKKKKQPAWSAISYAFGLGSTYSAQLCRRFNRDPETGREIT